MLSDTVIAALAVTIVLACALATACEAEGFEAANERPVYWRTA